MQRALRRPGVLRRTAPLFGAALAALALLLTLAPSRHETLFAESAIGVLAIWALALVGSWARLPRAAELAIPLLLLGLFAAVRVRLGSGMPGITLAPVFLIPVFWIAIYGTRGELWIVIAILASLRLVPAIVHRDEAELAYSAAALLVSAVVSLLAQRVVERTRATEESLRRILDQLPVGFVMHQHGYIAYANQAFAKTMGYDDGAQLVGVPSASFVHPDERARLAQRFTRAHRGEALPVEDRRMVRKDGGEVVLEIAPMALHFGGEHTVGAVLRDVTGERSAAEREKAQRAQLEAILSSVADGVAIVDADRKGIYANPAYLELFGLDADDFRGLDRPAFIAKVSALTDEADRVAAMLGEDPGAPELVTFMRPRRRIMRRTFRRIELPTGSGFLVVWHDVTADHDLAAERERLAATDPLTGLPNRRAADDALVRELARARRAGTPLCVALLDLDHFKRVNDTFGHHEGDRVLVTVAGVLRAQARITDVIARWGGEEFLAVLPGDRDGARAYCARVREALAELSIANVGAITISAGIAELARDESIEAAVGRADAHLYDAKAAGRDRIAG